MSHDLLLYNGSVHTMDQTCPVAPAALVHGGRIAALGPSDRLLSEAAEDAMRIDLGGRVALPGFHDAHLHFCYYGLRLGWLDLRRAKSLEEAQALVAEAARDKSPDEWLLGMGWNHNDWPNPVLPSRRDLDAVAPHLPVVLHSKDFHSVWVNTRALQAAGVGSDTPVPEGGRILRDGEGAPSGILSENAVGLITDAMPEPDDDQYRAATERALRRSAQRGITAIHNCEGPRSFRTLQRLRDDGRLSLRVWHMIPLEHLDAALELGLQTGYGDEMLRIGHVKMFADGALGSGTAEMLAPYEKGADDRGVAATDTEALYAAVLRAAQGGLASAIHAIGDAANRRVLDIYARVADELPAVSLRQRIEHVQLLSPQDLPRLAQLNVIASMQPIHATQDMEMAERQWGSRCRWAYDWRSLLERGTHLALGTDCPVEAIDPLANLYAAVTRQRPDGRPEGGWYPQERLTLQQALYGYTMGSAYACCREGELGSLTPGKLADVCVLSQDIFGAPPEALLETQVDLTVVGGRIVYQREEANLGA